MNVLSNRQSGIDKDFTQKTTITLNRILYQMHCKDHAYRHFLVKSEQDWMKGEEKIIT